jgi:hypothetical protein
MDHFDEVLASAMVSIEYSAAIHAAVRIRKHTLNRYYSKTDYSDVYHIAMSTLNYFHSLGTLLTT